MEAMPKKEKSKLVVDQEGKLKLPDVKEDGLMKEVRKYWELALKKIMDKEDDEDQTKEL